MKRTVTTFVNVPAKNPRKLPIADLKALSAGCLLINSPTYAPIKGPIITPNGPKNKPMINPTVEPYEPPLVPPNILVPYIGNQ